MNMVKFGVVGLAMAGLSAFADAEMIGSVAETNDAVVVASTNNVTAATVNPAEAVARTLPKLEGLFGYTLSAVLPPEVKGMTNDEGVVMAGFSPKKDFLGFSDYMLYVSPESKKVFQIQASRAVMPDEGPATVEKVLRFIEFRFDQKAVAKDANNKVVFFADGDFIRVSCRHDRVYVDACCDKLMRTARDELARAREARERDIRASFKDDLASLQLMMNVVSVGETGMPVSVTSVLGRKFGEAISKKEVCESLPDGSWCTQLDSKRAFVGHPKCFAFGSARNKSVFRVRAVWLGDCSKGRYVRIRRVVEMAMKAPMVDNDENSCRLVLGNIFVTLTRSELSGRIALDFSDTGVYAHHLDELDKLPHDNEWRDVEAL